MKDTLRPVLALFGLLTVLTGVAYPLLVTIVAQTVFHYRANGSIVYRGDEPLGSDLIGQHFDQPEYFWGRISATGPVPYTAFNAEKSTGSTGSNYGPLSPALVNLEIDPSKLAPGRIASLTSEEIERLGIVQKRIYELRRADPENAAPIPVDLVTASASGLDPHISPAAAEYQVARVARARGMSEKEVRAIVAAHTQERTLWLLGEPRVNVLSLNRALQNAKYDTSVPAAAIVAPAVFRPGGKCWMPDRGRGSQTWVPATLVEGRRDSRSTRTLSRGRGLSVLLDPHRVIHLGLLAGRQDDRRREL